MEDFTITTADPSSYAVDHGIRTIIGATREQAKGAQEILMNTGSVPLTITLAPGTGIYARVREKAE